MNFTRFRAISLCLVSLAATAAYAVEQLPEKDEDVPVEFIPKLDNTISIGMRHLSTGPKVRFGNLGRIPPTILVQGENRQYSNGGMRQDAPSNLELLKDNTDNKPYTTKGVVFTNKSGSQSRLDGNVVTVFSNVPDYVVSTLPVNDANGMPTFDANGNPITTTVYSAKMRNTGNNDSAGNPITEAVTLNASTNKFIAYQDGQTRTWSVNSSSQLDFNTHRVSMSNYSTESTGFSIDAPSKASSGFEVSLEHKVVQRGRWELGVSGRVSLGSINAKASAEVTAMLVRAKDIYNMVNTGDLTNFYYRAGGERSDPFAPDQPGNAKTLELKDQLGNTVTQYVVTGQGIGGISSFTTGLSDLSFSTPLETKPINSERGPIIENDGLVQIQGHWKLKGAYYNMQFGPTFRYRFNDRWAVSGGAGFSLAYVGTIFKADEQVLPRAVALLDFDIETLHSVEENNTHKFVPGYYVNFNAEYWMTERTGFYFGMNRQELGTYHQNPLSDRTAKIELGKSSGWQLGIMTRF
jgi:hypothetical protein